MRTLKVDGQRRVRLGQAKPGQVFEVEMSAGGVIKLTPVKPIQDKPDKVRLLNEDGYTVAAGTRPITQEQVRTALDQFP